MSRHELEPSNPDHSVVVGWDPPLQTFFVQVKDTTKDEDDENYMLIWEGYRPDELAADEALGIVEKYVKFVPADLLTALHVDCGRNR